MGEEFGADWAGGLFAVGQVFDLYVAGFYFLVDDDGDMGAAFFGVLKLFADAQGLEGVFDGEIF